VAAEEGAAATAIAATAIRLALRIRRGAPVMVLRCGCRVIADDAKDQDLNQK